MGALSPGQLVTQLSEALAPRGFDIISPLALSWYNDSLPGTLSSNRIRPAGRAGSAAFAVLVGSSAVLWRPFLQYCAANGEWAALPHPLEAYVECAVSAVLASLPQPPARVVWSHSQTDCLASEAPGYVAMQRAAVAAGTAWLDPCSHLLVHPRHGPWLSLRCLLLFDDLAWAEAQPPPLPCPLAPGVQQAVRARFEAALHATSRGSIPQRDQVQRVWEMWVATREALSPGHPGRYCDSQLQYHYTRNKEVLRDSMEAVSATQ
ncbi:hypothetical protein ACKKBG_A25235 [Auxenochlorella protothecoides x Auxenochlorella symbiontica]